MTTSAASQRQPATSLIVIAFAAIYVIWGSTYLGIRFAVESLPPFLMGGARFLTAGLILYGFLRATGVPSPLGIHWRRAALASFLLLGIGNGCVNWAEQKVSSGLTALIIAGTPVWFAVFDWLRPRGSRPTTQTMVGIAVGFFGVTMLVGSRFSFGAGSTDPLSIFALVGASMAWAMGSLYTRYSTSHESPMMVAAQQMITGGVILTLGGLVMGEAAMFDATRVSMRSILALAYLTLVGSLVGFSTYAWLLKATTPAQLSTYAYVNPVIAVLLGWVVGGETLTSQMVAAAVVIVMGVVIITTRRAPLSERLESDGEIGTSSATSGQR